MIVFNDHRFSGNCYPLKVGSSPTAKAYAENEKDPYKKLKEKKMSIKNVFLYHFWLKRFIFAFLMFYYFMVSLKLLSAEFSPSKRIFFHPFISASADIGFGIFYFQYQILFLMFFINFRIILRIIFKICMFLFSQLICVIMFVCLYVFKCRHGISHSFFRYPEKLILDLATCFHQISTIQLWKCYTNRNYMCGLTFVWHKKC